MKDLQKSVTDSLYQIEQVIFGKEQEIQEVMLAFLAGGHVLLEDIPGVGKTTLALAFSRVLDLEYRRVQFTPDLMPSDLTGFSVYRREKGDFVYRPGTVFCNIFLADEINRASPKTQSALLEVMEEQKVTVDGVTREVPSPFLVIATQNPSGSVGTQLLPEAQLDRFMISASLGYPSYENELDIIRSTGEDNRLDKLRVSMDASSLLQIRQEIGGIYVSEAVARYILNLVTATRQNDSLLRGGSPRATIALTRMAKASAWLAGRNYVAPEDVAGQFGYVILHRLILTPEARIQRASREDVARQILKSVRRPMIGDRKK